MRYAIRAACAGVVLALSASAFVACASSPRQFDAGQQCYGRTAGWQRLPDVPSNRAELLNLNSGGTPVTAQLSAGMSLREMWFSRGDNSLMVCRFEDDADVCPVAITVEFARTSSVWSAGPVESRTCSE
jgi:hypothetical protein